MTKEQIINQYISVYEGHAMEKEELETMLNEFADDIVNNLKSSLPDNLDEETEEWAENEAYGKSDAEFEMAYKGFKAGAEWMAKQIK